MADPGSLYGHSNEQSPPPRGSRLEVKRVDETYDVFGGANWYVQEDYKELKATGIVEPFAEYSFLLWREITPSRDQKEPPRIETYIDIMSEHLKKAYKEVIGEFMGVSWTAEPLRVHIYFDRN